VKKHKQKGEGEFWRIMRKKKELARVEINSARAHKKKKKTISLTKKDHPVTSTHSIFHTPIIFNLP
jgi:hypothetical protein